MALQRWDPVREPLSLRDAVGRLFEDSYVRPATAAGGAPLGLALDIEETADAYTVRASLPGFRPEDVDVTIADDALTIRAERGGEEERRGATYLLRERQVGSMGRSVALPMRIDADAARARYEHGELILTLPQAEETKPKRIRIGADGRPQLAGTTADGPEASAQR